MAFTIECGPCKGTGYYGLDPKDTCLQCNGFREIALPGNPEDYRACSPCHGTGYYGFDPKDTCQTCSGFRYVLRRVASANLPQPNAAHEKVITETLNDILPSAAASYQQAVSDLKELGRVSMRGTAAELREAFREVLDYLAPDGQVENEPGFRYEKGQLKPTMRQKAHFILRSRRFASLVRSVYQAGALATHIASSKARIVQLKRYVDAALIELLGLADS